mmetsp:Transcript_9268/g.12883  ORF Transcript_9268/g.12883 Transcript_9268/m.12883 type:complete len:211 (-) Transcript_9268:59-691(-)
MGAVACCHAPEEKRTVEDTKIIEVEAAGSLTPGERQGLNLPPHVVQEQEEAEKVLDEPVEESQHKEWRRGQAEPSAHMTPSPSEVESTTKVPSSKSNGSHSRSTKPRRSEESAYQVILERNAEKLGMVVGIVLESGNDLKRRVRVKSVTEGGDVWAWNEKNPSLRVDKGHLIIEVEGVRDVVEIVELLGHLKGQTVTMLVRPPSGVVLNA